MGGDDSVERLTLPESVIGWMRGEAVPERQLLKAILVRPVAGRAGVKKVLVVVCAPARHRCSGAGLAALRGKKVEVDLPECTVVKPVVAHPAVDHRALGRGNLQRGMWIQQRHGHGPAVIGGADHADALVRFRHILDQPVDRVPGVRRVIGLARIERTHWRTCHDIRALGAVFAADVLIDKDVAVVDPLAIRRPQCVAKMRAVMRGKELCVIRRALQQHRQIVRALGNNDDCVQLHAIAHGNHLLALDVVVVGLGLLPLGGNVAASLNHVAGLRQKSERGHAGHENCDYDTRF